MKDYFNDEEQDLQILKDEQDEASVNEEPAFADTNNNNAVVDSSAEVNDDSFDFFDDVNTDAMSSEKENESKLYAETEENNPKSIEIEEKADTAKHENSGFDSLFDEPNGFSADSDNSSHDTAKDSESSARSGNKRALVFSCLTIIFSIVIILQALLPLGALASHFIKINLGENYISFTSSSDSADLSFISQSTGYYVFEEGSYENSSNEKDCRLRFDGHGRSGREALFAKIEAGQYYNLGVSHEVNYQSNSQNENNDTCKHELLVTEANVLSSGLVEDDISDTSKKHYVYVPTETKNYTIKTIGANYKIYDEYGLEKYSTGGYTPLEAGKPYLISLTAPVSGHYFLEISAENTMMIETGKKLVGSGTTLWTKEDVEESFRTAFVMNAKAYLAQFMKTMRYTVLDIAPELVSISNLLKPKLQEILNEYGISLINFYILDVSIAENDPNYEKINRAYADKGTMTIQGANWDKFTSKEILKDLANSDGGGSAGANIGLGLGAMGMFGNMAGSVMSNINKPNAEMPTNNQNIVFCSKCGTKNQNGGKFCTNCGNIISQKKICPKCGAEVAADAKFCAICGGAL